MDTLLNDYPITHGGIRRLHHPRLGIEFNAQTCVRYLRFMRPVRLHRLELPRSVYGRWVPAVPTHPAHLVLSTLERASHRWQTVREVDLPYDPRTAGEGLSQAMSMPEMEAHFAAILQDAPYVIDLQGLETDHLRVECDREHPAWPNHGECNGGPYNVPFGILDPLRAYGETLDPAAVGVPQFPYLPGLVMGELRGMTVRQTPFGLHFESKQLSVCFSLHRPLLTHLGWDILGQGQAALNRLLTRTTFGIPRTIGGLSGPLLRAVDLEYGSQQWTGEVSVRGNQITYRNLHCTSTYSLDAVFTIEPQRLLLELTQTAWHDQSAIETEAWRLAWDATAGATGAAVVPDALPGRNGRAHLPALFASDGAGCLSMRLLSGDPAQAGLQVESYRAINANTGGLVLAAPTDLSQSLVIPQGQHTAMVELAVANLAPRRAPGAPLSEALQRHWATTFSCFRPEFRGFANNAVSTNCHLSQAAPMELVAMTEPPAAGPDPLDLGRYTVETALADGGGYGYWRNLYLDSDPALVCSAGRLHQAQANPAWLKRIEAGLVETIERMLGTLNQNGLVVCRDLSGNRGSFRWSCNSMDVVGFGHLDAYVNAFSYRAFRNAAALLDDLHQTALARRARDAAQGIQNAYAKEFVNPKTGWVAGWCSRDGQLHDYAFTYINGMAISFGLLDPAAARQALLNLEALRRASGAASARLGIPFNLLPFKPEDHILPQIMATVQPTFETYTDGSLSAWPATYYLRALSLYGLNEEARRMADEMEEGYAAGYFSGGVGTGREFHSWDGLANGYEGTLIGCFSLLYSIAIEKGVLTPPDPEWWPKDA